MKMNIPQLTIAIPTYQRPDYLEQAIDSAIYQLKYRQPYKIIVVNNDPKADMSYLINKYKKYNRIKFFINEKNLGMLGNVNRCVELADTKYIAFLHDDDLLMPNYIAEVEKYMSEDVKCLIPQRYIMFEGDIRGDLEKKRILKQLLVNINPKRWLNRKKLYPIFPEDNVYSWQNCYCAPSCGVIFDRNILEKSGLFFPEGTYSWDFISFYNLNKKTNIYILPRPLSVYRMTSGLSMKSETKKDFFIAYEELKKQYSDNLFVKKFFNEISYLNYLILDKKAEEMVDLKKYTIIKKYDSKIKYSYFMIKRLMYLSTHHLDVERPFKHSAKKLLMKTGII